MIGKGIKLGATLLAVTATAQSTKSAACASLEECGISPNYPFYYDAGDNSNSFYRMVRVGFFQSVFIPSVFYKYEAAKYRDHYGKEKANSFNWTTERAHYNDELWALERASIVHLGLWGTATIFNFLALFGILPIFAAIWMEFFISNLNFVVLIYVTTILIQGGTAWWFNGLYSLIGLITIGLEVFSGQLAIKHLRPNYPYKEILLIPSLAYLLGIDSHVEEYGYMSIEWPEPAKEELVEEE